MGVSVKPGYDLTLFLEVAICDLQFPTSTNRSLNYLFAVLLADICDNYLINIKILSDKK